MIQRKENQILRIQDAIGPNDLIVKTFISSFKKRFTSGYNPCTTVLHNFTHIITPCISDHDNSLYLALSL